MVSKIITAFCDNTTGVKDCDVLMFGIMTEDLVNIYANVRIII